MFGSSAVQDKLFLDLLSPSISALQKLLAEAAKSLNKRKNANLRFGSLLFQIIYRQSFVQA